MEGDASEDGGGAAPFDGVLGRFEGLREGFGRGGLVTLDRAGGENGIEGDQAFLDGGVVEEGQELEAVEGETVTEGGEVAPEFGVGPEKFDVARGGMCGGCVHAVMEFGWRGWGALKVRRDVAKLCGRELSDARKVRGEG